MAEDNATKGAGWDEVAIAIASEGAVRSTEIASLAQVVDALQSDVLALTGQVAQLASQLAGTTGR